MSIDGLQKNFFNRHLERLGEDVLHFDYRQHIVERQTLVNLLTYKSADWGDTPMEYLSELEALARAISICLKNPGRKDSVLKAIAFCQYSLLSKEKEVRYLSSLSLGILFFELALLERNTGVQKIHLGNALQFFKMAKGIVGIDQHTLLYLALIEVARDDLMGSAVYLTRAAYYTKKPRPLFFALSQIYLKFGMERVSLFYFKKAAKKSRTSESPAYQY